MKLIRAPAWGQKWAFSVDCLCLKAIIVNGHFAFHYLATINPVNIDCNLLVFTSFSFSADGKCVQLQAHLLANRSVNKQMVRLKFSVWILYSMKKKRHKWKSSKQFLENGIHHYDSCDWMTFSDGVFFESPHCH